MNGNLGLNEIQRVHILGICGTLMAPFAVFLKRHGIDVTGSDAGIYPPMSDLLARSNIKIFDGYYSKNIDQIPTPDLFIIGNVIQRINPEMQEIVKRSMPYCSLPEFMESHLLKDTTNVVVSGTHGKTTTSSLMSFVLKSCNRKLNYFIGGVSKDLPESFFVESIGKDKIFVLEGDEYDTAYWDKVPKFNHYLPNHVVLTSIEYDHADIYPDMNAVLTAFEGLVNRIRSGGHLIACYDYEHVRNVAKLYDGKILSYGLNPEFCETTLENYRSNANGCQFDVVRGSKKLETIELGLTGRFNTLNALAVWIEAMELKLPSADILKALKSFQGVKRRQEIRGEINGITVLDDFAHHPTAVRETLLALSNKFSPRRIIAVFEPRSATSRRKIFQNEYAKAFLGANVVVIAPPHDQSMIAESDRFSSDQLLSDLKKKGTEAFQMKSIDDGVNQLMNVCRSGDVIAVLSNGGFGGFINKLLTALKTS